MVDQGGCLDQPGVGGAGAPVVAAFGAYDAGLLLGPPHVEHTLGAVVAGQVGLGQVVLALILDEVHHVQAVPVDELANGRDERLGHWGHQRRGGELVPAVEVEESGRPARVLQQRLVHVEVHPVDRFDLERHMPVEDIGHAAR